MGKFEDKIINTIDKSLGMNAIRQKTFDWLKNDHTIIENLDTKELLDKIFICLNGDKEGLREKRKTNLKIDAFYSDINIVIEIDEVQHFTRYRYDTLKLIKEYENINIGYDIEKYLEYCNTYFNKAMKKGQSGYRLKKKEFPQEYGRCMQRAYLDSIRDVIIPQYLNKPVVRFSKFELLEYNSEEELQKYIKSRLLKYL